MDVYVEDNAGYSLLYRLWLRLTEQNVFFI